MLTISIDTKSAKEMLKKVPSVFYLNQYARPFSAYMRSQAQLLFRHMKHGNVTYRGVTWPWFAPQYTRADGTVVPAEGGVAKIRGKGKVKGRLRHSGKRITKSSNLLRDTGLLSKSVNTRGIVTRKRIILETNYPGASYQNDLRPFAFFIQRDKKYLLQLIDKKFRKLQSKGN